MTTVASFISRLQQCPPKSSSYQPLLLEGITLATRVDDLGRKQLLEACSDAVATLKYNQQWQLLINDYFRLVAVTAPHSIPKKTRHVFFKVLAGPGCSYPLGSAFAYATLGIFSSRGNSKVSLSRFMNGVLKHNPRLSPTLKKLLLLQPDFIDLVRTCLRKAKDAQTLLCHLRMWERLDSPSHLSIYGACLRALHSFSPSLAQVHKLRAPACTLPTSPQEIDPRSIADLLFVRYFAALRSPCQFQDLSGEELTLFLNYFHHHASLTEHGKAAGCYATPLREKWMTPLSPLDLLGLILPSENFPQIWPLVEQDVEKHLVILAETQKRDFHLFLKAPSTYLFLLRMAYLHPSIQLSKQACDALMVLAKENSSFALMGILAHHIPAPDFLQHCDELKSSFYFAHSIREGISPSKKPATFWGVFTLLNAAFSEKHQTLSDPDVCFLSFASYFCLSKMNRTFRREPPEYAIELLGLVLKYIVALARKGLMFSEISLYNGLFSACIEHACVAPALIACGQLALLDKLPRLPVEVQTTPYERLLILPHSLRHGERVDMIEALGHLVQKEYIPTLQPASKQVVLNLLSAPLTEDEQARIQAILHVFEQKGIFLSWPAPLADSSSYRKI